MSAVILQVELILHLKLLLRSELAARSNILIGMLRDWMRSPSLRARGQGRAPAPTAASPPVPIEGAAHSAHPIILGRRIADNCILHLELLRVLREEASTSILREGLRAPVEGRLVHKLALRAGGPDQEVLQVGGRALQEFRPRPGQLERLEEAFHRLPRRPLESLSKQVDLADQVPLMAEPRERCSVAPDFLNIGRVGEEGEGVLINEDVEILGEQRLRGLPIGVGNALQDACVLRLEGAAVVQVDGGLTIVPDLGTELRFVTRFRPFLRLAKLLLLLVPVETSRSERASSSADQRRARAM